MTFLLNDLFLELKNIAINNSGFAKVEYIKINKNSIADTELPKLILELSNIEYLAYQNNQIQEEYTITLTIINKITDNPSINIKAISDKYLNDLFNNSSLYKKLHLGNNITLENLSISNVKNEYDELGGESAELSLKIKNLTQFNNSNIL